ncbi:hypothetical protein PMAYCL1PPCAC_08193, partial [Pristionchus mayeri]
QEDRDRERAEFEERIERLEEALRKAVEEKESLEEELVDEAEKIHHNVTQSVEKMRRKRSIRFSDARCTSADSDSMSVVTPGLPIQRPSSMLPLTPITPADVLPSPIISLTDTENNERALVSDRWPSTSSRNKMASIDEESNEENQEEEILTEREADQEKEKKEEEGREEGDETEMKGDHESDKEKEEEMDEEKEKEDEDEKKDVEPESGDTKEEIKDQSIDEDEHIIDSRSVKELNGEKEKTHSERSIADDEMEAESGMDDFDTEREEEERKEEKEVKEEIKEEEEETKAEQIEVEEGKEKHEEDEEEEKKAREEGESILPFGSVHLDENDSSELSSLREQLSRLNELRERAQRQLAPASNFKSFIYEGSTDQMIFDLTTEFRRTANFLRGLLAVSPLSEQHYEYEEEEGDASGAGEHKEEPRDSEIEDVSMISFFRLSREKREEILEDLERLVEFAEVVKDSGKGESEPITFLPQTVDNSAIVKQLNDALLDRDDVPKGINEVRFASHLQSHMNSATGRPQSGVTRVKLPIKVRCTSTIVSLEVAQVSSPNGSVVHKPPTPPLRQPRFKF